MAVMNGIYQRYPLMGPGKKVTDTKESTPSVSYINNNVSNSNAYKQYQQSSVNTASPQELTLMLYNGLVRFLKLAHESIEEKDMEKANNNLLRAQDIIMEFCVTLDMQYEVSNGLMAMYDYMNWRLVDANLNKDNSIVEEIISYAEDLRDTWVQAMKLAKQQAVEK